MYIDYFIFKYNFFYKLFLDPTQIERLYASETFRLNSLHGIVNNSSDGKKRRLSTLNNIVRQGILQLQLMI